MGGVWIAGGLPDIQHRKEYLATAERLPDYRITCILVERGLRGQGLAAIALRGAVELIAHAGGGLVEGYPHETGGVRKKNSSFLYNGTRAMYEREGFTYDRPKGQGNCVMVREVAASTSGSRSSPVCHTLLPSLALHGGVVVGTEPWR